MAERERPQPSDAKTRPRTPIAENRRARHEYHFLQEIEAGIVLVGTEVKALREGKVQLSDGYAQIRGGEVILENVHIGHFKQGNQFNHEEKRSRKLLLHSREIEKLRGKLKDQGVTLIPISIYFRGNKVKILLGLGKGKQAHDKRNAIKERDVKREMSRELA